MMPHVQYLNSFDYYATSEVDSKSTAAYKYTISLNTEHILCLCTLLYQLCWGNQKYAGNTFSQCNIQCCRCDFLQNTDTKRVHAKLP